MAQALSTNPTTTNSPSTEVVPIIGQRVDLSREIESDVVPENEIQKWEIQISKDLDLAKEQFQKDLQHKLGEIQKEAGHAYVLDNEIDPVPPEAYSDTYLLLEILFDYNIPIPHIGWAEDGSIGLEWRPADGIVTMGIYGDGLVIYCAFFSDERQVEGICALSDTAILSGFLETLLNLHFE